MDIGKVLDRVKKLLRLAKSSNEHEASLAAEQAQRLLIQYNLTIAELGPDEQNQQISQLGVAQGKRLDEWVLTLARGCAESMQCRVLIWKQRGSVEIRIIGTQGNCAVAGEVFRYLYCAVDRIAAIECEAEDRRFRNQFRKGMAWRLAVRLVESAKQVIEQVQATVVGTALVRQNDQQLTQYMEQFARRTTARPTVDDGFQAGQRAAESVGLNRQIKGKGLASVVDRQERL